jgi:peptidoglycan/xylan/chitin deacetylase (PgdA/CDA1 family)
LNRATSEPGGSEITGRAVPILMYHSLDDSGSVISVSPAAFTQHMRLLAARGFHCIRLDELIDAWNGRARLPPRPVVLTFDDGFANVLEVGLPVLREHGFRATVFAIPGLTGGSNEWPGQASGIPRLPLLSWAELRRLVEGELEVGAHTMSHPRLSELTADEAEREITESRATLEQRLGCPVRTFAYPFGIVGSTDDVVSQAFDAACGTRLGTARSTDERHELPRLDTYYFRHPVLFRTFGRPTGTLYVGLRRLGNGARVMLERWGVPLPA